jgi:hypothetical protein
MAERSRPDRRKPENRTLTPISPEQAAYASAAENVENLELYLKEGFLAQFDPNDGTIHSKIFLTAKDNLLPDPVNTQDTLRAYYDQISWDDIKQSRVFTDSAYHDALSVSSLFDPNLLNAQGERMSQIERAAGLEELRGNFAFAVKVQELHFPDLSLAKKFLKDTDGKLSAFDALTYGVLGLAYVKTVSDSEHPFDTLLDDLEEKITFDNAANLGLGVMAGYAAFGTAEFLFGGAGVGAVIALAAAASFDQLKKAVESLSEAFPNWTWLPPIVGYMQGVEDSVGEFIPNFDITLPNIVIADGPLSATGTDYGDFGVGLNEGRLFAKNRGQSRISKPVEREREKLCSLADPLPVIRLR